MTRKCRRGCPMAPQKYQRLLLTGSAGQPSIFKGNLKAKQKNKAESLTSTWGRKCVIPAWLVPLTQQSCSAPLILVVHGEMAGRSCEETGSSQPRENLKHWAGTLLKRVTWSFVDSIRPTNRGLLPFHRYRDPVCCLEMRQEHKAQTLLPSLPKQT